VRQCVDAHVVELATTAAAAAAADDDDDDDGFLVRRVRHDQMSLTCKDLI